MLYIQIWVSHWVESLLCYWVINEKDKILSRTTVQQITADKPRGANIQEHIRNYHGFIETEIRSDSFGISLDGYDAFINDDEDAIKKGDGND